MALTVLLVEISGDNRLLYNSHLLFAVGLPNLLPSRWYSPVLCHLCVVSRYLVFVLFFVWFVFALFYLAIIVVLLLVYQLDIGLPA